MTTKRASSPSPLSLSPPPTTSIMSGSEMDIDTPPARCLTAPPSRNRVIVECGPCGKVSYHNSSEATGCSHCGHGLEDAEEHMNCISKSSVKPWYVILIFLNLSNYLHFYSIRTEFMALYVCWSCSQRIYIENEREQSDEWACMKCNFPLDASCLMVWYMCKDKVSPGPELWATFNWGFVDEPTLKAKVLYRRGEDENWYVRLMLFVVIKLIGILLP